MSAGKVSRLAYFPKPYPDELLYSIVARYARHMAVTSTSAINRDLFGNARQCSTFDLPNRVGELARRIPPESGLTASRLVRRHTLFPYYRALSPLERSRVALGNMTGNGMNGQALAKVGPYVPRTKVLRFCDECAAEMMESHGEMYWCREHQLPGTLACRRHRRVLLSSVVRVESHIVSYVAATEATCPTDAPPVVLSLNADRLGIMLAVADAGSLMLGGRSWRDANDQAWRDRFHAICRRKGISVGTTYKSRRTLVEAITKALAFLEPVWPRMFEEGTCGRWTTFVDRIQPQYVIDPVLRILAEQAIERMPDRPDPFGTGPWPCMNPIGGHLGDERIREVRIKSGKGRKSGLFVCGCGYAYTRAAFRDGRVSSPKLWQYGPTLTALVVESIARGRSLTATADMAHTQIRKLRDVADREGFSQWSRLGDEGADKERS